MKSLNWKKLLLFITLFCIAVIAVLTIILYTYDFNKFKPRIVQAVKEATGRELVLGGDIEFAPGLSPGLAVKDIRFQNADWGSRPDMIRLRRFEIEVTLLPLIRGVIEIERIILEAPDILIETDKDGRSNLAFETPGSKTPEGETAKPAPTIIIHEALVEEGLVQYKDGRSDGMYTMRLDRLSARSDVWTGPLDLDIRGAFEDNPIEIKGRLGQLFPALESGKALTADLTVRAAGAEAIIVGEIKKIAELKGLMFTVSASGRSVADVIETAGVTGVPDPGPFRLTSKVEGSADRLTVSDLELHIGSEDLATVDIRGAIGNLVALESVDLNFKAGSEDSRRLAKLFDQALPLEGRFGLSGRFTTQADDIYRFDDVKIILADSDLEAEVELNLTDQQPQVNAVITSQRFDLRPFFKGDIANDSHAKTPPDSVKPVAGSGSPTTSPDSILRAFNADVKLQTGRVLFPDLTLKDFTTHAQLKNGRISAAIKGPALPDIEQLSGITHLQELGAFNLTCDLMVSAEKAALKNLKMQAGHNRMAEVRVSGAINNLADGSGFNLDFNIRGKDAAKLGRFLVQPWPLQGNFSVSGRMVGSVDHSLRFKGIYGRLEDIDFKGAVDVDLAGPVPLVVTTVSAQQFNLRPFSLPDFEIPESMRKMPTLGPLNLAVTLSVPAGPLGLRNVNLAAGTSDLAAIKMTGSINDLEKFQGVNLQLLVRGDNVSSLEKLIGSQIPIEGAFTASTFIKDPVKRKYRFGNLKLAVQDSSVTGFIEMDVGGARPLITAALSSPKFELQPLLRNDEEAPPIKADTTEKVDNKRLVIPDWEDPPKFLLETDASIQVSAGVFLLPQITINDLKCTLEITNGNISITADSQSITGSAETVDFEKVSEMGVLDVSIKGRATESRLTLDTFRFHAGTDDTVVVKIDGKAGDILKGEGVDFKFLLQGQDVAYLGKIFKREIITKGPFSFSGRIEDPSVRKYNFNDLELKAADSDLNGQLELDLTGKRPRIAGRLSSRKLDLRPYLAASDDDASPETKTGTPAQKDPKVFSSEPFKLEALKVYDADIHVDAGTLLLLRAAMNDLSVKIVLENGNLTVKPLRFKIGGGTVDGRISLKAQKNQPTFALTLKIDDYSVGQMMDELEVNRDIEGTVNASIKIKGPADSIAGFMAGLNGRMVASMNEGRLNNRYIGMLYADLRSTFMGIISPFRKKGDQFIDLNCLIPSIEIQNGLVQLGVLLDTSQTTVIASGKIDLKVESLNITLKPDPKGTFKLGKMGSFGFSLSELTKPFKLGGTLAKPSLEIDPTQTALTFGKLLGGLALGPAGIAYVFSDIKVGEENVCANALEAVEKMAEKTE